MAFPFRHVSGNIVSGQIESNGLYHFHSKGEARSGTFGNSTRWSRNTGGVFLVANMPTDFTLAIPGVGDGQAALAAIQAHPPDVAVLDIDLPGLDGFAVVRTLATLPVRPAVVFLTVHSEQELFAAALELGINGYVLKESAATDIVAAIQAVTAGQSHLSPALSPPCAIGTKARKTAWSYL